MSALNGPRFSYLTGYQITALKMTWKISICEEVTSGQACQLCSGALSSRYPKEISGIVTQKLPKRSHGIHCKHKLVHHESTHAGGSPVGTTTATTWSSLKLSPVKVTFTHHGHIYMETNFAHKALHCVTDFAAQFNKNSFDIIPSTFLAMILH
ncbi:hypothetical protein A6R68_19728 [Neotoma lepida]|uniref:Uncharacterized protein n=1 Tax=Neotoma lepida TaxID=56216 RepID=A0A1A6HH45_NEOLE|nr:hypothetical protein A6R68_19728 [Neotoma lepida]